MASAAGRVIVTVRGGGVEEEEGSWIGLLPVGHKIHPKDLEVIYGVEIEGGGKLYRTNLCSFFGLYSHLFKTLDLFATQASV